MRNKSVYSAIRKTAGFEDTLKSVYNQVKNYKYTPEIVGGGLTALGSMALNRYLLGNKDWGSTLLSGGLGGALGAGGTHYIDKYLLADNRNPKHNKSYNRMQEFEREHEIMPLDSKELTSFDDEHGRDVVSTGIGALMGSYGGGRLGGALAEKFGRTGGIMPRGSALPPPRVPLDKALPLPKGMKIKKGFGGRKIRPSTGRAVGSWLGMILGALSGYGTSKALDNLD